MSEITLRIPEHTLLKEVSEQRCQKGKEDGEEQNRLVQGKAKGKKAKI